MKLHATLIATLIVGTSGFSQGSMNPSRENLRREGLAGLPVPPASAPDTLRLAPSSSGLMPDSLASVHTKAPVVEDAHDLGSSPLKVVSQVDPTPVVKVSRKKRRRKAQKATAPATAGSIQAQMEAELGPLPQVPPIPAMTGAQPAPPAAAPVAAAIPVAATPTAAKQDQPEAEFVEGQIMDADHDEGMPFAKTPHAEPKPVAALAKKKQKRGPKAAKAIQAEPGPGAQAPANKTTLAGSNPDHDDRGQRRTWENTASRPAPLDKGLLAATDWDLLDWVKTMPAIVPRVDGSFTSTQLTVMDSLTHRAAAIHGFIRAYRRVTLPNGVFATLWIGPSQASNLDTCIIARIPASRMPAAVNEFTLGTAALEGWAAVVKGWPNYRLNTKYRVGQDRITPWEVEPGEVLDLQIPAAGAPEGVGAPGAWVRFSRGAE